MWSRIVPGAPVPAYGKSQQCLHSSIVFDCIEAYAPGFKVSVIGRDILTPPDLERIFGLPGGVGASGLGSEQRSCASWGGDTVHTWALFAEHLSWRDVSGPALLHPTSTILLDLPVSSPRLIPVRERSPPW